MIGYLYVVDEEGAEIEGSRRMLAHCRTLDDYHRTRRALEALAGSDCTVLDSEVDRRADG